MTQLNEYVAAITDRAADYEEAQAYYEGVVPEVFSSAKLRRALRSTGHQGQHNYCRVVVDAVLNRLEISNVYCDKERANRIIQEVWKNNELGLEANEIHRKALEYGDCYALVWPDEEGNTQISYNSPRTTALVYDPENPRKKLYAVKMWKVKASRPGDKGYTRLNIYTADYIYKYRTKDDEYITEATDWTALDGEENPFGEVPVFHFRTHRPYGRPEHYNAYGAQNDINKLLATHMYTVDYQGAPQRYALAMQGENEAVDFQDDDTERENISALKSKPGDLWYLKGIHNVGQFQPADPKVFWDPIRALKESMSALTDTPYHYLERGFAGVSGGEALRVAEAPLLKKVADRQTSFGVTWVELFTFVLKIEGADANVEIKWDIVESFDSLNEWDVMLKKINAGLSHRQALREAGYEEDEIDRIMQERAEEASASQYYNRTDANGQQSLQNVPAARVSTDDNAANNENRNGLTEQAKVNGGRGEE